MGSVKKVDLEEKAGVVGSGIPGATNERVDADTANVNTRDAESIPVDTDKVDLPKEEKAAEEGED